MVCVKKYMYSFLTDRVWHEFMARKSEGIEKAVKLHVTYRHILPDIKRIIAERISDER